MENIMKYLVQALVCALLSTQILAKEKVSVDFDTVSIYESTLSKISLSVKPQKRDTFHVIFSYVSSIFSLEQAPQSYNNNTDYKQVKIALNFKF